MQLPEIENWCGDEQHVMINFYAWHQKAFWESHSDFRSKNYRELEKSIHTDPGQNQLTYSSILHCREFTRRTNAFTLKLRRDVFIVIHRPVSCG